MGARGLLARIGKAETSRQDSVRDIVEHLKALLNTRRGEAVIQPSYGIVDFTDVVHNFPNAVQVLRREIKATITEFEPRLTRVEVKPVRSSDPLVLAFEIRARLTDGGQNLRIRTSVNPGGRFTLNS